MIRDFLDDFTSMHEDHALGQDPVVITGDFNIHWDETEAPSTRRFMEPLLAFGLVQHVYEVNIKNNLSRHFLNK